MKKRILCLLMALVMAASLILPISAASAVSEEEAAQVVSALNIMVGDERGELNLEQDVKRSEFITMAVKASVMGDKVGQASTSPYPDVPRTHWAAGFVQTGVQMGLISGYLDGTFRPDNKITLAEGATIVLKLLGYTGSDFSGAYPTAQMTLYRSLGLDEGVYARNSGDILDRRDAMYLFYNLLSTQNKNGQYHLNTLGYSLTPSGEVDRVALLGQVMEGPIVAGENWADAIPFSLSGVQVVRAGISSTVDDIQNGDLIYWNEGMRKLWVYTDRVTGTIQALAPSAANPTSVNVAGRTFAVETAAAAYALSDLGSYRLGDTVTVALGRNGGVAAVMEPNVGDQTKVGIVTAVNRSSYSGSNGTSYTADTVTLQATDGKVYSYPCSGAQHYEVGDLLQVVVGADTAVTFKRLQKQDPLTGTVSADGTSLGKYPFADDVQIMDTYENTGIRVFPGRLAGVYMKEDMVRYYALNTRGEIQYLILDEVTGDMHRYGIITELQDLSYYMNILVNYTMDFGGQTTVFSTQTLRYPVEEGPFQLKGSERAPDMMSQLTRAVVDRFEGNAVVCGSLSYPLLDGTLVYERRDGAYYLSSLDRVKGADFVLTAWYDKPAVKGGGVRVLVAEQK